jgi:hypothetical protein
MVSPGSHRTMASDPIRVLSNNLAIGQVGVRRSFIHQLLLVIVSLWTPLGFDPMPTVRKINATPL